MLTKERLLEIEKYFDAECYPDEYDHVYVTELLEEIDALRKIYDGVKAYRNHSISVGIAIREYESRGQK